MTKTLNPEALPCLIKCVFVLKLLLNVVGSVFCFWDRVIVQCTDRQYSVRARGIHS